MSSILDKAVKSVSDTIAVVRARSNPAREIHCAADTEPAYNAKGGLVWPGLPDGFFIVKYPDGRTTLGYKFPSIETTLSDRNGNPCKGMVRSPFGYGFNVKEEFKHPGTGEIIKLNVPRAALPLFKLNLRKAQVEGVAKIGNFAVLDTEALDRSRGSFNGNVGNDGTVTWVGQTPRDGVDYT